MQRQIVQQPSAVVTHAAPTRPGVQSELAEDLLLKRQRAQQNVLSQLHENGAVPVPPPASGPGTAFDFGRLSLFAPKPIGPRIQAKLMVNDPGDAYEREADEVAERVMDLKEDETLPPSTFNLTGDGIQRQLETSDNEGELEPEEEEDTLDASEEIQRKSSGETGNFEASTALSTQLNASKGAGVPIPSPVRQQLETAFGANFSKVRVHTDARSISMNKDIKARAFTHGSDIYFNQGEFVPEQPNGKLLLAHELVHTLQQRGGMISRRANAPVQEQSHSQTTLIHTSDEIIGMVHSNPSLPAERVRRKLNELDIGSRRRVISLVQRGLPPGQFEKFTALLANLSEDEIITAAPSEKDNNNAQKGAESLISIPVGNRPNTTHQPSESSGSQAANRSSTKSTKKNAQTGIDLPKDQSAPLKNVNDGAVPQATGKGEAEKNDSPTEGGLPALRDLLEPLPEPEPTEEGIQADVENLNSEADFQTETDLEDTSFMEVDSMISIEPSSVEQQVAPEQPNLDAPLEDSEQSEMIEEEAIQEAYDIQPLVDSISAAPAEAETNLEEQKKTVRNKLSSSARATIKSIHDQMERSIESMHSIIEKRRKDLDASIKAEEKHIADQLKTRTTDIVNRGKKAQTDFREVFTNHRKTIEQSVIDNKAAVEKLRTDQIGKTQTNTIEKANDARARGRTKASSYPDSERGRVQKDAVRGVADSTAQEIEQAEPDTIQAINDVIAPLPEEIEKQGGEALIGYDSGLPDLLSGIDKQVMEAKIELMKQAQQARAELIALNKGLNERLAALKTAATAKAEAIKPQAETLINAGKQRTFSAFNRVVKQTMEEIGNISNEATEILSSTEHPNEETSLAFADMVLTYIHALAEETSTSMQAAGEGTAEELQKAKPPARQGIQAIEKEFNAQIESFDQISKSKLTDLNKKVETNFEDVCKKLDSNFNIGKTKVESELNLAVIALKDKFEKSYKAAEEKIIKKINEGLAKNDEALSKQGGCMQEAASDAAWDYDHPVLSTLRDIGMVIAGIIVGILAILVVIVLVIVAIKVLAIGLVAAGLTAATAALVAKIIIVGGLLIYSVYQGYQAYEARVASGQSSGSAFLGVLGDFTGITSIHQAFTNTKLSPYERGKAFGEGATTLVLTILGARSMGKKFLGKTPPKLPNPARPPAQLPGAASKPPSVIVEPVPQRPPAQVPSVKPATKPITTPEPALIESPPSKALPSQASPSSPTSATPPQGVSPKGLPVEPPAPANGNLRLVSSNPPKSSGVAPVEPSLGTNAPAPARPQLRGLPSEVNPKLSPSRGKLRSVSLESAPKRGSAANTNTVAPEPVMQVQPKPLAKAVGAEGFEPIVMEGGSAKPKLQMIQGGASNPNVPGGRSPLQAMASGPKLGGSGGGNRPVSTPSSVKSTGGSSPRGGGGIAPSKTPAKQSGGGSSGKASKAIPAPKGAKAGPKASKATPTPKGAKVGAKASKATPTPKGGKAGAKASKATPTPKGAKAGAGKSTKAATPKKPAKAGKSGGGGKSGMKQKNISKAPQWKPTKKQLSALLKMSKPPRGSLLDKQWRFARYKAGGGKKSFQQWLPKSHGGKGGGAGHQQIQQQLTDPKLGAPKGAKKEVAVGNRFADAFWPKQGKKPSVYHQIGGKNPKRGDPIVRERQAIEDIRNIVGKKADIWFWDKRNPSASPLKNPDLKPGWHKP